MTLLATERIKLFSTRSPWFCMVLAVGLTVGLSGMIALRASADDPASTAQSQVGYQFGMVVVMVMAALAVTTEYRTGTIRTTFQAVPNRAAALLAKAGVVTLLAGVLGEITAFASWGVMAALAGSGDVTLSSATDWRAVAGVGAVYAVAALISVAVGILVRHSAGAISLLLVYTLLGENLVMLIPTYGVEIHRWLPFTAANAFLPGAGGVVSGGGPAASPLPPWAALGYFAAIGVVLLGAALLTARKRDSG